MKYRIKEYIQNDGKSYFRPQKRICYIWFSMKYKISKLIRCSKEYGEIRKTISIKYLLQNKEAANNVILNEVKRKQNIILSKYNKKINKTVIHNINYIIY